MDAIQILVHVADNLKTSGIPVSVTEHDVHAGRVCQHAVRKRDEKSVSNMATA